MVQVIQALISGLMVGAVYALIALGIVAVYKTTRVVNFAHGYVIMFGAYLYYAFTVQFPELSGMPQWLFAYNPDWMEAAKAEAGWFTPEAAWLKWIGDLPRIIFGLIFAMIGASLMGILIERFMMRPLMGQSTFSMIMVTVGLISVISGIKTLIWPGVSATVPSLGPDPTIKIQLGEGFANTLFIRGADIANMILALALFAGIVVWLRYSKSGVAIRAASEDQSTAYSMGINVPRVFMQAWIIAAATGAIAGAILAGRSGISPSIGLFGFSVLAIVLMGGLDSYIGCLIAAMGVGMLEALAQTFLGGEWTQITPYVAVLIVILIKPHGLMGHAEVERI